MYAPLYPSPCLNSAHALIMVHTQACSLRRVNNKRLSVGIYAINASAHYVRLVLIPPSLVMLSSFFFNYACLHLRSFIYKWLFIYLARSKMNMSQCIQWSILQDIPSHWSWQSQLTEMPLGHWKKKKKICGFTERKTCSVKCLPYVPSAGGSERGRNVLILITAGKRWYSRWTWHA